MTSHSHQHGRLQQLSKSDFEVADGQPDIRSWKVTDTANNRIGTVEELIFDVEARKVRYLVVNLEDNALALDPRSVLVPIGLVLLHKENDHVIVPDINGEQLLSLPEFDDGAITPDTEIKIASVFGLIRTEGITANEPDAAFYSNDLFNDSALYRNYMTDDLANADMQNDEDKTATGSYSSNDLPDSSPFVTEDTFREIPPEEEMVLPVNHHSLDDEAELRAAYPTTGQDNNSEEEDRDEKSSDVIP